MSLSPKAIEFTARVEAARRRSRRRLYLSLIPAAIVGGMVGVLFARWLWPIVSTWLATA